MAYNSKIEWCHHTFNPWIGCTKVGPGCDHCYAESQDKHRKWTPEGWGAGNPRKRTSPANWKLPLRWNREAEALGRRYRVFCASLADVFDNEVPGQWRLDLFNLIRETPHLDWLLLTKRVGNVDRLIRQAGYQLSFQPDSALHDWLAGWLGGNPPANLWLGATIVTHAEADRDIPKLLQVPARIRWLSMEPLLGPVNLSFTDFSDGMIVEKVWDIDWVVVGGESGHGARPMDEAWARSIRDQCGNAGVPFFMKQMGGAVKSSMPAIPPDLLVMEFPNA